MNSLRPKIAVPLLTIGFALAGALGVMPASAAEDAFVCMDESKEKCDEENQNLQLYIQGHDAFDRGRESGDLGEARKIARELMKRNDMKHGKALMKYVYVQVMQGVHKNPVEAYRWAAQDIADGTSYPRLNLERVMEQLAAKMTPEQLAEAKK